MKSKKSLISIICAVRNDERFIRETLETVVSQSYPHWELIIMDGASTDGTLDIMKEYAAKYKNIILRSEPDEGQWHALDKGLSLACGEYIMLLCGQDGYLNKDWFKHCVQTFEEHPDVSLVWGIPLNMSEYGKLLGPHYAYASFLKDDQYNSRTKPIRTLITKINWHRPSSVWRLLCKLTWSRALVVLRSFRRQEIPQKENWFFYWLRTGRAFPEGNMCVRKEVYIQNTVRFPKETMTNGALLDFCFNFNTKGYLAYGLPIAASFGRSHAGGQPLREYDNILLTKYQRQVMEFRKKIKEQKVFKFINPAGDVVSERVINL
jgi:glycosyltransferase involved in cell wall biosynthesis